jgi:hypothetical protein
MYICIYIDIHAYIHIYIPREATYSTESGGKGKKQPDSGSPSARQYQHQTSSRGGGGREGWVVSRSGGGGGGETAAPVGLLSSARVPATSQHQKPPKNEEPVAIQCRCDGKTQRAQEELIIVGGTCIDECQRTLEEKRIDARVPEKREWRP